MTLVESPVEIYWIEIGAAKFYPNGDNGLAFASLDGWYDLPDLRGIPDNIPHGHGRFRRSTWWRDCAAITVSGWLFTTGSRSSLDMGRLTLLALLEEAREMRVADSTGVWVRKVDVESVKIEDRAYPFTALQVTIDLTASDPARYLEDGDGANYARQLTLSVQRATDGLTFPEAFPWFFAEGAIAWGDITNTGLTPIYPSITVMGGSADEIIIRDQTTGHTLRYPNLLELTRLKLDTRARQAILEFYDAPSTDVTPAMLERGWIMVPPGETHRMVFTVKNAHGALQANFEYKIGVY